MKKSKLSKIKELYLKFMNSATGKLVNVLVYQIVSNAVTVLTQYFAKIDITDKAVTYVIAVQTVNIVLVFLTKVILPLFKK